MTSEHKKAWICDACYSKKPKTGNLNTPIRQEKTASPPKQTLKLNLEGSNNKVTAKAKPLQPVCTIENKDQEPSPSNQGTVVSEIETIIEKRLIGIKKELIEEFKQAIIIISEEHPTFNHN